MRSKLGTALDIFIILIGPIIIYSRVTDIMRDGVSLYPVLSIIIIGVALAFAIFNLLNIVKSKQNDQQRKK